MVLETGEIVHVITRRQFDGDIMRHFIGSVEAADGHLMRVRGYTFVLDLVRNEFVKREDKRTRIMSMIDVGNIINILPPTLSLDAMCYQRTKNGRVVLADGTGYELDINEFGSQR